jgi:predicted metal-dependent hydrolase
MKTISAKEFESNPTLKKVVEPENDLKNFLVEYTGEKLDPEDQHVTVEMIADVMANEFPEFLLAIAEENWIRGYQQAIQDVEEGLKIEKENDNKHKKNYKLCEKPE